MFSNPDISFFLYESEHPIDETSPAWNTPLPLNRTDFTHRSQGNEKPAGSVTHGEYFAAASHFLKQNSFSSLCRIISSSLKQEVLLKDIKQIKVFLEKHGRFYHPARVSILLAKQEITFVLNVAVTELGRFWIDHEFQILKKLNHLYTYAYLPRVYHYGEIEIDSGRPKITLFVGEWFQGYHEFHLSWDQKTQKYRIAVWDPAHGKYFLSYGQTFDLYKQAAKILTLYYQVETYQQIFPWHHAAGDFIVRPGTDAIDVRLVTVRQYAPLTENTDQGTASILNELMLFFLNLTIWMRLDREDGVGEILWAEDVAVEATIHGFFEGLRGKPPVEALDEGILTGFNKYLSVWGKTEIMDLFQNMMGLYHPQSPEISVMHKHLEGHLEALISALIVCQTDMV